jgi:hypothetical protein
MVGHLVPMRLNHLGIAWGSAGNGNWNFAAAAGVVLSFSCPRNSRGRLFDTAHNTHWAHHASALVKRDPADDVRNLHLITAGLLR